jgi:phosphoribosylformylglycinamidine synthase
MKALVYVTLKPGVLDPQGKAVRSALHALGHAEAADVRVGKFIEVALEGVDKAGAEARVKQMCETLLANTVIESYRFDIVEGDRR